MQDFATLLPSLQEPFDLRSIFLSSKPNIAGRHVARGSCLGILVGVSALHWQQLFFDSCSITSCWLATCGGLDAVKQWLKDQIQDCAFCENNFTKVDLVLALPHMMLGDYFCNGGHDTQSRNLSRGGGAYLIKRFEPNEAEGLCKTWNTTGFSHEALTRSIGIHRDHFPPIGAS